MILNKDNKKEKILEYFFKFILSNQQKLVNRSVTKCFLYYNITISINI